MNRIFVFFNNYWSGKTRLEKEFLQWILCIFVCGVVFLVGIAFILSWGPAKNVGYTEEAKTIHEIQRFINNGDIAQAYIVAKKSATGYRDLVKTVIQFEILREMQYNRRIRDGNSDIVRTKGNE